jgi:uncharacterized UBP type Zn finger protein
LGRYLMLSASRLAVLQVRQLVDMGFGEAQARHALAQSRGDLDAALAAEGLRGGWTK